MGEFFRTLFKVASFGLPGKIIGAAVGYLFGRLFRIVIGNDPWGTRSPHPYGERMDAQVNGLPAITAQANRALFGKEVDDFDRGRVTAIASRSIRSLGRVFEEVGRTMGIGFG